MAIAVYDTVVRMAQDFSMRYLLQMVREISALLTPIRPR